MPLMRSESSDAHLTAAGVVLLLLKCRNPQASSLSKSALFCEGEHSAQLYTLDLPGTPVQQTAIALSHTPMDISGSTMQDLDAASGVAFSVASELANVVFDCLTFDTIPEIPNRKETELPGCCNYF